MNKRTFYVGLFLLFFLLVCTVYLFSPLQEKSAPVRSPAPISAEPKQTDFTEMLDDTPSEADQPVHRRVSAGSAVRPGAKPPVPITRLAAYRPAQAVSASGSAYRFPKTNTATQPVKYARPVQAGVQNSSSHSVYTPGRASASGAASGSGSGTSIYAPVAQRFGAAGYPAESTSSSEEDSFVGGAGFHDGLTKHEAKLLDERLRLMSAGLDRAIAQALMPKSKREQMIEKYSKKEGTSGAAAAGGGAGSAQAADPARRVMAQIASQSKSIISSMRSAYGDKAAAGAEQIMKDFEREMAAVFNAPGDPFEKQLRAQKINHKYNAKLARLNEREGKKKMEASMREQNEKQLQKMSATLSPQAVTALRQKYEEYIPKRMAIYQAGLSEEETARQEGVLNEQLDKDVQQLLAQHQPQDPEALNNVVKARNETIMEELRRRNQLPEKERPPEPTMRRNEESLKVEAERMKKENANIAQSFSVYGPEVQAQAERILNETMEKRLAIAREGGSLLEFNELAEDANRRLEALQQQAHANIQQQGQAAAQPPEQ